MTETPFDDPKPVDETVFDKVEIYLTPKLETVVSWALKKSVPFEDGLFVVERSIYGEPFNEVTDPIDDCMAVINDPVMASPDIEAVSWRVAYHVAGNVYTSIPLKGHLKVSKSDKGLLNVIAHREAMTFDRYSGTTGLLLKARTSGRPCPVCTDWGIETSARSACPNCYGTGHAGGFYNGKPWKLCILGAPDTSKSTTPTLGSIEAGNKVVARALFENPAEAGDIWINKDTQERWQINGVKPEVVFKGLVITIKLEMTRLQLSEAHPINNPETSEKLQQPSTGGLWETL